MSAKLRTAQKNRDAFEQFREIAKKTHAREGTLEIDEGAAVSFSDDGGAYVAAWVWVYGEVCRTCGKVFQASDVGQCEDCADKTEGVGFRKDT